MLQWAVCRPCTCFQPWLLCLQQGRSLHRGTRRKLVSPYAEAGRGRQGRRSSCWTGRAKLKKLWASWLRDGYVFFLFFFETIFICCFYLLAVLLYLFLISCLKIFPHFLWFSATIFWDERGRHLLFSKIDWITNWSAANSMNQQS